MKFISLLISHMYIYDFFNYSERCSVYCLYNLLIFLLRQVI